MDITNEDAMIQAKQLREWLQMFEGAAKRNLIPQLGGCRLTISVCSQTIGKRND